MWGTTKSLLEFGDSMASIPRSDNQLMLGLAIAHPLGGVFDNDREICAVWCETNAPCCSQDIESCICCSLPYRYLLLACGNKVCVYMRWVVFVEALQQYFL